MKILITGVTGFLGRHIATEALAKGHEVIGGVRSSQKNNFPPFKGKNYSQITLDLPEVPNHLAGRLDGVGALVHTAGIITGLPEDIFRINVEGTRTLLRAASMGKGMRFVYISSMAIFEAFPGVYGESKKRAEEAVRSEDLDYVLLRPTMIYGKDDAGWTRRIQERVTRRKPLLLPGGGRNRIQPVYVVDVARAVLAACCKKEASGQAFDLGGPEPITHYDFLRLTRQVLKGKTLFVPIPLWPLRLAGKFMGHPFAAMAAFCEKDHLVDIHSARETLEFHPRPPSEGLPLTFSRP